MKHGETISSLLSNAKVFAIGFIVCMLTYGKWNRASVPEVSPVVTQDVVNHDIGDKAMLDEKAISDACDRELKARSIASRGEDDVCHCGCHVNEELSHRGPCCYICDVCGRNIRVDARPMHTVLWCEPPKYLKNSYKVFHD